MTDWKQKLDIFLAHFEHINEVVGILVCGSYITGNPTNHSDLDVHLILDSSVDFRERGNKIVDGLLIEYFANPPQQILKYFEEDISENSLMAQTQFATGEILLDKNGEVQKLKEKARAMIADFYVKDDNSSNMQMFALSKYGLWDMLDDLQDAFENGRPDFDFLYFNNLDRMIAIYMGCINRPYHCKVILGNITDSTVREKYLLKELPDAAISGLIVQCIKAASKDEKLELYQRLTTEILDKCGGFSIDGFKFKSGLDI